MKRELSIGFDAALEQIPKALAAEGFGVLTEIDVKATLKKKLDVDFRRYKILGACNPPFAHRALTAVTDIGVMLPCNVAVHERDDGGVTVLAIDPVETMGNYPDPAIRQLASEVKTKLSRVLEQLG
ncbi:MAG: DUF302 domain-containing protein [Deltaproteobacteria bacterium]|nr:DUF302 domain-containing protein [Deltaproteobacteria bacterium]